MEWIKELKISIIENDENRIEKLLDQLPQFETLEEMEKAAYLMQEAHSLLSKNRDDLANKLVKIKKQKEFVKNFPSPRSSFDQSH